MHAEASVVTPLPSLLPCRPCLKAKDFRSYEHKSKHVEIVFKTQKLSFRCACQRTRCCKTIYPCGSARVVDIRSVLTGQLNLLYGLAPGTNGLLGATANVVGSIFHNRTHAFVQHTARGTDQSLGEAIKDGLKGGPSIVVICQNLFAPA
jgi:hypothetical protein